MLKRISRFSTLLFTAFLLCFLLSPTAFAQTSNSTCNNKSYTAYQGVRQTLPQNVDSYKNNYNQAYTCSNQNVEYKITEASPQPKQSCKQYTSTTKQNSNTGNCAANSSKNCNTSNCNTSNCATNNCATNNCATASCSQKNTSCNQTTAVKPAQTTKPAQSTTTGTQSSQTTVAVANYAEEVVRLVNVERAKNNLAPLTLDKQLSAAALVRAQEAKVKFSHTRPDGSSCFTALTSQGISYRRAGENIAIGQSSPAQVVKAWMDSPGHRANIMGDYTKIGVGVHQAGGNFSGYSWAQFFTK